MTIGFAGFVGVVWSTWNGPARVSWVTFLYAVMGVASVFYWAWTEANGSGDLRPYAVAAFLPMFFVPLLLLIQPKPRLTPYIWCLLGLYLLAKLLEYFDAEVFTALGISGHSLKHVFAAAGSVALALGLARHAQIDHL